MTGTARNSTEIHENGYPGLTPGWVVQLHPEKTENPAFAGCFLVVTEAKDWGVQGYVQCLGDTRERPGAVAYYRAKNGSFAPVGLAYWTVEE